MNWLYFIVMAYIVLSAVRGFHKGVIRVIYSVAALVISAVFIALATPMIGDALKEYTPIPDKIESVCEDYARKQVHKKLNDAAKAETMGVPAELPIELPWVKLPKALQQELKNGTQKQAENLLETYGIYKKMAQAIADFCVSTAAFFLSSMIISAILAIVGRKLNLFSKVPGIHLVNMVLGFFAGIGKAFLVIWLVFLLIKVAEGVPVCSVLVKMIKEDVVLKGLYEQNPLLELMQKLLFIITGKKILQ